jgi:hypothetical protein
MPLNLPTLFARCPPKKEDKAAGMRIVETTSPCTVEESEPNVVANWGIVVRGPIVPVSSLGRIRRGGVKVGGDEGVGSGGTRTKHRQRRLTLLVGRILVDGAMIYASWKY